MLRTIELLLSTIAYRPYVFVFFAAYLFIAVTHIGWKRTALFTALAYLIAFLCEWSSAVAATGFPFGLYYYINQTSEGELWIAGVPFMDSLSFTFLSYTSWELATLLLARVRVSVHDVQVLNGATVRRQWQTALLAAFLMMYLDIIIDPVALRGERWFLGKIYYYPDGGIYFGVTLANFLGWFFVCFVIVRLFVFSTGSGSDRAPDYPVATAPGTVPAGVRAYCYKALGPIGLYCGVLGFNLFMTFRIGETLLGVVGVIIVLPLLALILLALQRGTQYEQPNLSQAD